MEQRSTTFKLTNTGHGIATGITRPIHPQKNEGTVSIAKACNTMYKLPIDNGAKIDYYFKYESISNKISKRSGQGIS